MIHDVNTNSMKFSSLCKILLSFWNWYYFCRVELEEILIHILCFILLYCNGFELWSKLIEKQISLNGIERIH